MDFSKEEIARLTNKERRTGSLGDVIAGSDVFIGLSAGGALTPEMVRAMAPNPIVFALANPVPGDHARPGQGGRRAGGRHRPLRLPEPGQQLARLPRRLPRRARRQGARVNDEMKIAAAHAIADLVDAATSSRPTS